MTKSIKNQTFTNEFGNFEYQFANTPTVDNVEKIITQCFPGYPGRYKVDYNLIANILISNKVFVLQYEKNRPLFLING
jgi:hypothetical protein